MCLAIKFFTQKEYNKLIDNLKFIYFVKTHKVFLRKIL